MNNIKIYHNCGFRYNWNFDIYKKDKVGYGFILSPKDMEKNFLANIEDEIISKSFFDSQFYNLGYINNQYLSYGFFDCVDSISDYLKQRNKIAKKNIDYQESINLEYITIPTIDFDLLDEVVYENIYSELPNKIDDINGNNNLNLLNELIILPFTNYIKQINTEKKILLTVIFDESIAVNNDRFNTLLTMITNNDIIDGIYLIPKCKRTYKRISDIQFLFKIMEFIHNLKRVNMEVIVGNCDIESLLYLVAGADGISFGIYENLRYYDGNRFIEDSGPRIGPNPRLFSYKLLQWIDYNYLYPLNDKFDIKDLFDDNEYYELTKIEGYKWHFLKSEPYKHYMISFKKILDNIPKNSLEKIEYVNNLLIDAVKMNTNIENCGIILDENSSGIHLNQWRTVLIKYRNEILGSD